MLLGDDKDSLHAAAFHMDCAHDDMDFFGMDWMVDEPVGADEERFLNSDVVQNVVECA
jgi:hypothetical protein